jgi:hypothetical protein
MKKYMVIEQFPWVDLWEIFEEHIGFFKSLKTTNDFLFSKDDIENKKYFIKIKETEDIINNPIHYTQWWIEPIDYITKNNLNFCEWNIIKYVTRYKFKNWKEDLKKAKFYLEKLIGKYENK